MLGQFLSDGSITTHVPPENVPFSSHTEAQNALAVQLRLTLLEVSNVFPSTRTSDCAILTASAAAARSMSMNV